MSEMMGYNPETEESSKSDIDKALEFTKNKRDELRSEWTNAASDPEKQKSIEALIQRSINAVGVFSSFKSRQENQPIGSLKEHFKVRYEERMGDRQAAERKGDQQAADVASEQIRALDDAAYFESISHS